METIEVKVSVPQKEAEAMSRALRQRNVNITLQDAAAMYLDRLAREHFTVDQFLTMYCSTADEV